ncbi:nucleotidyltransferase family protein [Comamonas aquatica]|uniref:nucleotidyltransferase family protein n=1 Tax=Comamonas aquatica TaxID=225991 RepID=UPI00244B4233|nr:nucleotidyltransferase family protein [Comamonas aquatica]MDH0370935.1 nucleotidyltransferase family protein [Comamonas aquatica]MDH1378593.1 nucleotidyltransferase family protein [Comamonas aquatica]MDH1638406.1 nucleotidyltransferase family protein [Comamonas aquatica]MDH1812745.1 nucleotidyltransferase family protein [Comamonas aquatica]
MTSASLPAMLLAAGRGERMRPLTDTTPKPLLTVQGRALLDWHLGALQRDGVRQVLVNTAWLGAQIPAHLDAVWPAQGLQLQYSHEQDDFGQALETAGGIARAVPRLGAAFWLAAGDVYAPDFVFDADQAQAFAASDDLAHVWLVPNPAHHPGGDFGLLESTPGSGTGRALNLPPAPAGQAGAAPRYTYSTIALLKAALFAAPWCDIAAGNPQGVAAPLAPLLRQAMDAGRCGASLYTGRWTDVGTPERLAALNQ